MKRFLVLIGTAMFLALPMVAAADLQGDCVNCHTMHNSEQGTAVVAAGAQPGLLRFDCLGCHAQNPSTGTKDWSGPGGTIIPQVAHNDTATKAGGKFNQSTSRKAHSVIDVVSAGLLPAVPLGENANNQLPGTPHSSAIAAFTSPTATDAFDMFTCAGARGCHGTRAQLVGANNTNSWAGTRRTGIAAISGAHHNNIDGQKTSTGYAGATMHSGQMVADGYRFIVGLQGFESTARENVDAANHNEYYGDPTGFTAGGAGCAVCHFSDGAGVTTATTNSGINVPNNSMSGFCSSCHGMFHSAGAGDDMGTNGLAANNGPSGAFLRHPSDYIIPNDGREYAAYTNYDVSAPVARNSVVASASSTVSPGSDMVMCLSCHVAHGSANDYLLRFDYATMVAGNYTTAQITAMNASGTGGCLSCHTDKGVLPQNR